MKQDFDDNAKTDIEIAAFLSYNEVYDTDVGNVGGDVGCGGVGCGENQQHW